MHQFVREAAGARVTAWHAPPTRRRRRLGRPGGRLRPTAERAHRPV